MNDDGFWSVYFNPHNNDINLYSNDFTHDVKLSMDGDFASYDEKVAYAKNICERLNKDADKRNLPKL